MCDFCGCPAILPFDRLTDDHLTLAAVAQAYAATGDALDLDARVEAALAAGDAAELIRAVADHAEGHGFEIYSALVLLAADEDLAEAARCAAWARAAA